MKLSVVTDGEISEMEVKLDKINIDDKIKFQRKTSEVLYDDLLQSTLKISKMKSMVERLEGQLRRQKVENKANQTQIKRLQENIVALREDHVKVKVTKKLLDEKENTIQMLKKKLKVLGTQHVHTR